MKKEQFNKAEKELRELFSNINSLSINRSSAYKIEPYCERYKITSPDDFFSSSFFEYMTDFIRSNKQYSFYITSGEVYIYKRSEVKK